ncbi:hypothetical protein [Paenibacillus sp.]|uniref:hypothetical protein n=1 Tax=Paenibacillus sp. TaxID=58172 RepID=UPI0028124314|nr:hypothetical protein [Paenibacillus sp.]
MKRRMGRSEFDALADEELGAACFAPVLPLIRAKPDSIKQEVYRSLTAGQRALFMYHVYVDHAKHSAEQFYWRTAHYAAQPNAWAELHRGLNVFGATGLARLLDRTKAALADRIGDAAPGDLDKDEVLSGFVGALYEEFLRCSADAAGRIGLAIRANPSDFVAFEEREA